MSADTENRTDSEIIAHIDHENSQVIHSLQQLHQKLDSVTKHLGITTSGHQTLPDLISAHRAGAHDLSANTEHNEQMDNLLSQLEATLQQPPPDAPATAEAASRTEGSSIGAAVRKQLDLVGEQLANRVTLQGSQETHTACSSCAYSCVQTSTRLLQQRLLQVCSLAKRKLAGHKLAGYVLAGYDM